MKFLIIALSILGLLAACSPKTTEIIEASNSAEVDESSPDGSIPKADIGEGKLVFLTDCIDCHYGRSVDNAQSVIDSYSKAQWDEILPKMIKKAELDEVKARQVSAYVYWEIEN